MGNTCDGLHFQYKYKFICNTTKKLWHHQEIIFGIFRANLFQSKSENFFLQVKVLVEDLTVDIFVSENNVIQEETRLNE